MLLLWVKRVWSLTYAKLSTHNLEISEKGFWERLNNRFVVLGVCKVISLHLKCANLLYRLSEDSTVGGYFIAKKRRILLIIIK